jgi:hypothetical protein
LHGRPLDISVVPADLLAITSHSTIVA